MSMTIAVPPQQLLERILTLEIVRVTERAADALTAVTSTMAADPNPTKNARREIIAGQA